ncbi:MAG: hypothetical protein NT062_02675 [Proteobacteria bacterium]|nr:hypothetical protein [Pseudomonadota bacterium]
MQLEFRNRRAPFVVEHLNGLQREQLVIVGRHFDGAERSAESRLRDEPPAARGLDVDDEEEVDDEDNEDDEDDEDDDDDWDDGNLAAHGLELYEVWESERHVYDAWTHHGRDNGCLFKAGTTEVLAGRFQDTWMTGDTRSPLDEALHEAESAYAEP